MWQTRQTISRINCSWPNSEGECMWTTGRYPGNASRIFRDSETHRLLIMRGPLLLARQYRPLTFQAYKVGVKWRDFSALFHLLSYNLPPKLQLWFSAAFNFFFYFYRGRLRDIETLPPLPPLSPRSHHLVRCIITQFSIDTPQPGEKLVLLAIHLRLLPFDRDLHSQ